MTTRTQPAFQRKGTGSISAAISPNHALHQVCRPITRGHPIKLCREKRLPYTVRHLAAVRFLCPTPQP